MNILRFANVVAERAATSDGLERAVRMLPGQPGINPSLVDADDAATTRDARLSLIFTCCHPDLSADARMALILREVCGFGNLGIAQAMHTSPAVSAHEIMRAKMHIHKAGIPCRLPEPYELPERLECVLQVIHRVFNAGDAGASETARGRTDLSAAAIHLARLLVELMPVPEASGLLALLLLHEARRAAGVSPAWELILLEDRDPVQWDRQQISEGARLVRQALASRRFGFYTLQAAIVSVYVTATCPKAIDWKRVVGLYDLLALLQTSPQIELNRALALAMRDGPEAGLVRIERLLLRSELPDYRLVQAARAVLYQRLGRTVEARLCYRRAIALTRREPERRLLARRLAALEA